MQVSGQVIVLLYKNDSRAPLINSLVTEAPFIKKRFHWLALQNNDRDLWFLYDRDLRHERIEDKMRANLVTNHDLYNGFR